MKWSRAGPPVRRAAAASRSRYASGDELRRRVRRGRRTHDPTIVPRSRYRQHASEHVGVAPKRAAQIFAHECDTLTGTDLVPGPARGRLSIDMPSMRGSSAETPRAATAPRARRTSERRLVREVGTDRSEHVAGAGAPVRELRIRDRDDRRCFRRRASRGARARHREADAGCTASMMRKWPCSRRCPSASVTR